MLETLLRLLPVIVGMTAGFALRRSGLADHRDGETVFKLVFYVFLPVVMFTALSSVELGGSLSLYPLAAVAIITVGYLIGRLTAARTRLDPVRAAVLVSTSMIVNTGFALPYVQVLYGAEGVARIAAFDAVNATVTFTFAYSVAARGNPVHSGGSLLLG